MKKIFEEYGGVITTAMAIVALIGVIGLLFNPAGDGWMDGAFKGVIHGFSSKVDATILNEGGGGSGENSTGELVGYSYNGTVLPEIPEWDKETYPYAYLVYAPGWATVNPYTVRFSTTPAEYSSEDQDWSIKNPSESVGYSTMLGSNRWLDVTEHTGTGGFLVCEENPDLLSPNNATRQLVWCNADVTYPDGTVYLAASDPVPVYE